MINMFFTAYCTLRTCDPGEMFKDEFSRLLLTGTAILCFGCLLIIGIPIYYDIVPHEGAWASTLNRHYTYPDPELYKYTASQAEAVYSFSGSVAQKTAGTSIVPHAGILLQETSKGLPARQPDVQAIVLQVIDGDSIIVSIPSFPPILGANISVGLAEYDGQDGLSPGARLYAKNEEAKAMTASLAPPGSVVWLRNIHRDTSFGLLARVEVEGIDVGVELCARGLARPEKESGESLNLVNGKNFPARAQKTGVSCQLPPEPAASE